MFQFRDPFCCDVVKRSPIVHSVDKKKYIRLLKECAHIIFIFNNKAAVRVELYIWIRENAQPFVVFLASSVPERHVIRISIHFNRV